MINSLFSLIQITLYFHLPSSVVCFTSHLSPRYCFLIFVFPSSVHRVSHHLECKHCQHVLMAFILYVDSATTQEWGRGQKDRYDCSSFPEHIAVIRNIHRRIFCFCSQGNFGVYTLLFISQTYTFTKFLQALLDIISQYFASVSFTQQACKEIVVLTFSILFRIFYPGPNVLCNLILNNKLNTNGNTVLSSKTHFPEPFS